MEKTAYGNQIIKDAYIKHPPGWRLPAQMMRIMRVLTFIIFAACISAHANGVSQQVTISGKDLSFQQVFAAIKEQTGFVVFGNEDLFKNPKRISLSVYDMPLADVLDIILKDVPFEYVMDVKTVFISKRGSKGSRSVDRMVIAEMILPISGVVRDAAGAPLHGATIQVKGKSITAITDVTGRFSLSANEGDVLVVSYVGFRSKDVKVDGSLVEVILEQVIGNLDTSELVYNAGYYTVKERERTGSIARVDGKTIGRQPIMNPLEALIGRMAGVNIIQQTGVPGGGVKVEIRGLNSVRLQRKVYQ